MAKAVKKSPPSRVRYEAANPTVSCRVPKEVYDRLQVLRETEGRSFADVLKIGLGILDVQAKAEGEIRIDALEEGYAVGYEEAEGKYKVVGYSPKTATCGRMVAWERRSDALDVSTPGAGLSGVANVGVPAVDTSGWPGRCLFG